MRIIFVRHGHPNYRTDSLTELGHRHADAVALRLQNEKIDHIFSSSCGRARETAEHIATPRGMEVELLDFMREISWGSLDGEEIFENGHPWRTADKMVGENLTLLSTTWQTETPFENNKVRLCVEQVGARFDEWLATLGYTREGNYYRVGKVKYQTILLASHGGSSSAALARLFNLPFPFLCHAICPDFTAVTIVKFGSEEGTLTGPRFEILNDATHIREIAVDNIFDK
ncbi:MAG: histidine phosphatase family protein [Clostridia bacterium]|nr:histidine phosphatase family protein [Clostridia bacterium]